MVTHTEDCINEALNTMRQNCPGCSGAYVQRRREIFEWLKSKERSAREIEVVREILNGRGN